jgi:RNA polymerase sigma factor (sigma-70 family)
MAAKTATPPARPGSPKPPRRARPSGAVGATGQPCTSPTIRGAAATAGAFIAALAPDPEEASPARDDLPVADLVAFAKDGDQQAWDALVHRYTPLVWSICRRYRLSRADADNVGQDVWLQLVTHLDTIRDPAALPGWLATTTARESARAARRARELWPLPDPGHLPDPTAATAEQELLQAERHAALRQALADLPPSCQRLLALLLEDPPPSYATISARLGIPVGSIGPTRARCLHKLRRHPAVAALIHANTHTTANSPGQQPGGRARNRRPQHPPTLITRRRPPPLATPPRQRSSGSHHEPRPPTAPH